MNKLEKGLAASIPFLEELKKKVFRLTPKIEHDFSKGQQGWYKGLGEDSIEKKGLFSIELVSVLRGSEDFIHGDKLEDRFRQEPAIAGQRHLEAILRDEELLPLELRCLRLLGLRSVWLKSSTHRDSQRYLPYIYFDQGRQSWWINILFGGYRKSMISLADYRVIRVVAKR